jgi:hypothetical protein
VGDGPEDEWTFGAVGRGELDVQRTSARHPPHDLQFVARTRWNTARADGKPPNFAVRAPSVNLIRGSTGTESRRRGASCA